MVCLPNSQDWATSWKTSVRFRVQQLNGVVLWILMLASWQLAQPCSSPFYSIYFIILKNSPKPGIFPTKPTTTFYHFPKPHKFFLKNTAFPENSEAEAEIGVPLFGLPTYWLPSPTVVNPTTRINLISLPNLLLNCHIANKHSWGIQQRFSLTLYIAGEST